MRAEAHPPRPRWPWIILAAAIVILIAAVIIIVSINTGESTTTTPAPPVTSSAPVTPNPDEGPTGCLGGAARTAAMVLTAQKQAPHTSTGAIEVAASFIRWAHQYPYPTAADATAVGNTIFASSVSPQERNLAAAFAQDPNTSGGAVADNTPFNFTTLNGVWRVDSYATSKAVVSIGVGIVVNGALSPTLTTGQTVTLVWHKSHWLIAAATAPNSVSQLFQKGQPFTGGC
jgi:hypothetical protein